MTSLLIYRHKTIEELINDALETLDIEGKCCDMFNCICSGDNPTCPYEDRNDDTESESDEGFQN